MPEKRVAILQKLNCDLCVKNGISTKVYNLEIYYICNIVSSIRVVFIPMILGSCIC